MKLLITGASGFIGRHVVGKLNTNTSDEVLALYNNSYPNFANEISSNIVFEKCNLLRAKEIETVIQKFQPTHILHLASLSSVANSWLKPQETIDANILMFQNICKACASFSKETLILNIGSAEVYGVVSEQNIPIGENQNCKPISPYGISKLAIENLGKDYLKQGLKIIHTRSFIQVGAYQSNTFFLPSWLEQANAFKISGLHDAILMVGNVAIIRDILDVRDAVEAYLLLLQKGRIGEVYNVCSNKGIALTEIIKIIGQQLSINLKYEIDKTRLRKVDNPIVIGDNTKLKIDTGWDCNFEINQSIEEIIKVTNNTLRL